MPENRSLILDDLQATFEGMSIAGGYNFDIGGVSRKLKTFNEVDSGNLPFICFFPAQNQPQPEYESFGCRISSLRITVVGHVAADAEDDSVGPTAIGELEKDISRAFHLDSSRGGWAFDVRKTLGESTDEGVPELRGLQDETNTLVTEYTIRFEEQVT